MAATPKASEQYKKRRAQVDKELADLRTNLKKHATKQAKFEENWSYSGDMWHVAEVLRALNNFLK